NRRNDQTAHISLQISINVKEHPDKKPAPRHPWRAANLISRTNPLPRRRCIVSVSGYLGKAAGSCKRKNHRTAKFSSCARRNALFCWRRLFSGQCR
ncbi:hypothetical protein, partial [Gemmobacter sp.]|uniref:hypothetical protein n=1 Tax=Gemmobacter sp. TaxID=1898957 RepID=UPI0025B95F1E